MQAEPSLQTFYTVMQTNENNTVKNLLRNIKKYYQRGSET